MFRNKPLRLLQTVSVMWISLVVAAGSLVLAAAAASPGAAKQRRGLPALAPPNTPPNAPQARPPEIVSPQELASTKEPRRSNPTISKNRVTEPQAMVLPGSPAELKIAWSTVFGPGEVMEFRTKEDRRQLTVSLANPGELERDVTRSVAWNVEPSGVVAVDRQGRVVPLANGAATVSAQHESGARNSIAVVVRKWAEVPPVHFENQVVPILTKHGCNGGGCHGKAAGQNGFRLSLLGFEPGEDYEHLVNEARGRRLFPAAPDRSLLLLKAVGAMPHGGGKRIDAAGEDYRVLKQWIAQGTPQGDSNAPKVARIEVTPKERVATMNGSQQLAVVAHYTDGSRRDVTHGALFESNEKELAQVDESGWVQFGSRPGEAAVMVRYQAKVAVFRANIPLGAPIAWMPKPRNFIDEWVFAKLRRMGIPPSELSDDAAFLRRTTLDIAGRLPTLAETAEFLDLGRRSGQASDKDQDLRRSALVARLLDSPGYADFFANKWNALLRNKRTNPTHARGTQAFHSWIRENLAENRPFDQFVSDILTASGEVEQNPAVIWYRQVNNPTAELEDAAQLFLGTRMQCAQCHHHPYEKWSQQDYYGLSAFFSQVARKGGSQPGEQAIYHKRGVASANHKKTKQPVKPTPLGGTILMLPPERDPRQDLAEWLTGPRNPFFARTLVNRYWKHFFGRGLVEPEDDMRETNPPTNPELLDALASHFVQSGFDLKALVRVICESATYQLSSLPNTHNPADRQFFSRYYPKRLPAETLYDAIHEVIGAESRFEGLPPGTLAVQLPDNSYNASNYFLTVFGRPESSSACECERSADASLSQSLHLLNAKELQDKIARDSGGAARMAADTARPLAEKIRELYLLAFSRQPTDAELASVAKYFDKKLTGAADDAARAKANREACEDTVWALLSAKEFLFNH